MPPKTMFCITCECDYTLEDIEEMTDRNEDKIVECFGCQLCPDCLAEYEDGRHDWSEIYD